MTSVTISPKFQVVIPQEVRKRLNLKPGEKLVVVEQGNVIHLVPVGKLKNMRGFIKGASNHEILKGLRDETERFD